MAARAPRTARVSHPLLVMVAVPSTKVAEDISAALLDARLAACTQTLGPMTSRYTWKGKRETAREWLLLVKSRWELAARVERAVRAHHPYDVPEIVGVGLDFVHVPYLVWLESETGGAPGPRRIRRSRRPAKRRSAAPRRRPTA